MRSEIDRYLGWPAQAISYKIGQREWVAARDDARAREGADFDLKGWHTKALRLGAIGLDQLRAELAAVNRWRWALFFRSDDDQGIAGSSGSDEPGALEGPKKPTMRSSLPSSSNSTKSVPLTATVPSGATRFQP